jgi:hypothetical protein
MTLSQAQAKPGVALAAEDEMGARILAVPPFPRSYSDSSLLLGQSHDSIVCFGNIGGNLPSAGRAGGSGPEWGHRSGADGLRPRRQGSPAIFNCACIILLSVLAGPVFMAHGCFAAHFRASTRAPLAGIRGDFFVIPLFVSPHILAPGPGTLPVQPAEAQVTTVVAEVALGKEHCY